MKLRAFAVGDPGKPRFKVGGFAKAVREAYPLLFRGASGRPVTAGRSYKIAGLCTIEGRPILIIAWPDGDCEYPQWVFVPVR